MKCIGMLVVVAAVGLTGCVVDTEEDAESEVSDMESPALTEEAFVPNAINYTCGDPLVFKKSPTGDIIGYLPYGTLVWTTAQYKKVWEGNNERTYVNVHVMSGQDIYKWGWVYRGWVDQNCGP